jgi:uncharacterized protein YneF (UPF0154 family)
MSKKKIVGIVIIAIVGFFGILFAIGASNLSASRAAAADLANQPPAVEEQIKVILANDPNRINDIDWRQTALYIIVTGNTGDTAKLIVHASGG